MVNNRDKLLKQLIELKNETLEDVLALKRHNYDSIKNYINILEYCIMNLTGEAYHTIMKIVEFVADKYSFLLDEYEILAEEVQDKRDEEESKLYPEDLTGIQLTLYRRTTSENK